MNEDKIMNTNESKKINKFKWIIYITMGFVTLLVSFPFIYSYITTIDIYKVNEIEISNGRTDLTDYDFDEVRPFTLDGEWITYEGVYFDGEQVDYNVLDDATITELPIRNLIDSKGSRTYQMYIKLDLDETELKSAVIAIPFATDSIRVYVNGNYVEGYHPMQSWSGFDTEAKMYPIGEYYDENLVEQEISISINAKTSDTDLYNRTISISTVENVMALEKMTFFLEGMLVAMMFFSVISGIVFSYLLPSYSVLTFMNLFDTALMLHLFFNMSTLPQVVMDTVTLGSLGDTLFRRFDLFFLFLAGLLGSVLASLLFDEDRYYSKKAMKPIHGLYLILMITFIISPEAINGYGMMAVMVIVMSSFIVVLLEVVRCHKLKTMTSYKWFHFIKNIWLGTIVFIDIITINATHRPKVYLIIMYTLFFMVHVVVRAVEYRAPYLKLVETNSNLERIVEKRTCELQKANDVLKKISTVDPLTGAFNRMYFEEEFSKVMEYFHVQDSEIMAIHLCIFDLDNFKRINDTYGHQAGDVQLIDVVKHAKACVKDDTIVARIGGEEFILLFINYTDEGTLKIVENLRLCLEAESNMEGKTTGSFGVSKAVAGVDCKQLLRQADKCLYYAKGHGKNQIIHDFYGEVI